MRVQLMKSRDERKTGQLGGLPHEKDSEIAQRRLGGRLPVFCVNAGHRRRRIWGTRAYGEL